MTSAAMPHKRSIKAAMVEAFAEINVHCASSVNDLDHTVKDHVGQETEREGKRHAIKLVNVDVKKTPSISDCVFATGSVGGVAVVSVMSVCNVDNFVTTVCCVASRE